MPRAASSRFAAAASSVPDAAQRQQQIDRALDVEDAVRALDRHALADRIERRARRRAGAALDVARGGCRARRAATRMRDLGRVAAAGSRRRARGRRRSTPPPRRAPRSGRRPTARGRPSRPWSSVPVLSVQMTVAAPSVSTAGSLRTSTLRAGHALHADGEGDGDDGGQALGHGRDRERHRGHQRRRSSARRGPGPSAATTATMPRQRNSSVRPTRSRRRCSGVSFVAARGRAGPRSFPARWRRRWRRPRPARRPGGHRRAHEHRAPPLGQRRVGGDRASCPCRRAGSRR